MAKIVPVARILLGLVYFVFGLNGFLQFIPVPPVEDENAKAFMAGLFSTGYFFPTLKATEVICGLALLSGFFVPLSLVVLAPITLQIFLYHRFLAGGPPMDVVMLVLHLFLGWAYIKAYSGLLKAK